MKRSEMIQAICKHINDNVKYYYKNGVTFEEHEADYLLSTLERAGMKPPTIENPRYDHDEAFKYAEHPFLDYPEPMQVQEWDKE